MIITSLENKFIKNYYKLKQKKYREQTRLFLVEGEHLVIEANNSNLLEKIILLENSKFKFNFNVEIIYVTTEVMKKLSSLETPPNIIGVCKMNNSSNNLGNKVLILDDLQDPGNLGTIIRSSVAFNIDSIILSSNTVDLYNSKVIRSTQGMLFHINILKKDLLEFLPLLKKENYKIYSTNVVNGTDIRNIPIEDKMALIIGNEGGGVSKEVAAFADQNLYIKTNKNVESLNASTAAAILLYEFGGHDE